MAQEWETRARREFELNNRANGRKLLSVVMDAERFAAEGSLSASKAEELIRKLHRISDPKAKAPSLSSYWKELIERESRHLKPSSIRNMTFAFKRWSAALGKRMTAPLVRLRLDDLEAALPKMADGLSPMTVDLYRGELMRVLNHAVARRVIDSNPAKPLKTAAKLGGLRKPTRKGVFESDEIKALLDAADEEWRGMILCGFYTSLRLMDVARLSSEDIEGGFIPSTSKKTGTDTDTPIHPRLKEWLDGKEGAFFPNQRDASNTTVSSRFGALMKKAGVPRERTVRKRQFKRSFHSLRHSFASIVANSGVPQDVRMALTGSSDPKVASRYVHVSDEALLDAIAALPNLEVEEVSA